MRAVPPLSSSSRTVYSRDRASDRLSDRMDHTDFNNYMEGQIDFFKGELFPEVFKRVEFTLEFKILKEAPQNSRH